MPSSRSARFFARLVLAWFALYLGAAAGAPLLAPGGYAVVCSADGSARLVQTDDSGAPAGVSRPSLDCALCVPASAPPPPPTVDAATPQQPFAYCASPPTTASWRSALDAAPPPARGPPSPT
jgi:hypothetical protein